MSARYLFGPVTAAFADENLADARHSGECLAFHGTEPVDVKIEPTAAWESVQSQFPADWSPDFLVLNLSYALIPPGLWSAPVPIVGLAPDWNLLWHQYLLQAALCELVLTDTAGAERLHTAGATHARFGAIHGLPPSAFDIPDVPRDLDIVMTGNLHPAVQRERSLWAGRIAAIAERYRVLIQPSVPHRDERMVLSRAKIAFHRSSQGECGRSVLASAAAGALVFVEAENRDVGRFLEDSKECVRYDAGNLERLIEHFLDNEADRRAIALAGQTRVRELTFSSLWRAEAERIDDELPELQARMHDRASRENHIAVRAWETLGVGSAEESAVLALRHAAETERDATKAVHAGLVAACWNDPASPPTALSCFRQALELDPTHLMGSLNLADTLAATGQREPAHKAAERLLGQLDGARLSFESLAVGHCPVRWDAFRVEWEKAAWSHAGDPAREMDAKVNLVRWRVQMLRSELTGDVRHFAEALRCRPDLAESHAALGRCYAHGSRWPEASESLRRSLHMNPLDIDSLRLLFQAVGQQGDGLEQRRLARQARRLARVLPDFIPSEPWMTGTPPVGTELASILILCCNEVEYTKLCLESVFAQTRQPFELILVDNGSTDGTPEYLATLQRRPGPERVVVLRNETNRGFAGGVNQALAAAKGEFLVLLNNDTIVTSGWLDDLIACALTDWPNVGLVGPVSNYAAPPQQVPVDYADPSGIAGFALRRQREMGKQAMNVDRLTGFCLLIRRDVLAKIGGLDERYGLGFFEDDDLCVRARNAGYKLALALNVYIHHFGSRTFAGLGIDDSEQLIANFAKFQEKWGPEHAAGYRMPDGRPVAAVVAERGRADAPLAIPRSGRARVSLAMIVKNEEKNLPDCLRTVADLVDERVIVDTGSTDRTKEIALQFGAKVHEFPWIDSFAAARNESLRHATGHWIFWMDADDRLDEENRGKLRALFDNLQPENAAYAMKCWCVPDATGVSTIVDHVRLFRNHPDIRWKYRIHEQILPSLRRTKADVRFSDVVIQHVGYVDPSLRHDKLERDLRILRISDSEEPNEPFIQFNLGQVLQELGQVPEALKRFQASLNRSDPQDSIVRKLYVLCAQCHRQLNDLPSALAACRKGREFYPDDPDLLSAEALTLQASGDPEGAYQRLTEILKPKPGGYFSSVDEGLAGYRTRHNLAVICRDLGRFGEAVGHWKEALAQRGDFRPAWASLGELYLNQQKWNEVKQVADGIRGPGHDPVEANVLEARAMLIRKEFAAAIPLLKKSIAMAPQALRPRIVLSHALLQEGKDLAGAEACLREILALDPDNREAKHNLHLLIQQRARVVSAKPPTLRDLYELAWRTPSDINEHLPVLRQLASECDHVTEFGTRTAVSTTALLFGQPAQLVCYDLRRFPEVDRLMALPGRTDFRFIQADVLTIEIEETDLLFIDTLHDYDQLQRELARHAVKARKYIVLHDTTTFAANGETPGRRGLWPAVEEFLAQGQFKLQARYEHNNGLTVLKRG